MRVTPFFELESKVGAFFTEFAGWRLPLHFGSAIQEAKNVRKDCSFFDITHMGRVKISGPDSEILLAKVFSRVLRKDGKGLYGFLVSSDGRTIDDTVIFKKNSQEFIAIFNSARKDEDIKLLEDEIRNLRLKVEVIDISDESVFVAVQGPKSALKISEFFDNLGVNINIPASRFSFTDNGEIFISRTGYTGEDGFEIIVPAGFAQKIWDALMKAGIPPAGLAARDILRLEAGLILYGLDLKESDTPFGSHLERFVDSEFERIAVLKEKFRNNPSFLKGVIFESLPIPQHGDRVYPEGFVTSAVFSAILRKPIALVRFKQNIAEQEVVKAETRGKVIYGTVVSLPFVRSS